MDDYLLKHVQSIAYGHMADEPKRRRKPGTFKPGNVPSNKGRPWSEWMPADKQRKIRKQLLRTRHNGNPNWVKGCKAHNAVEVVAFKDGRKVGTYQSATIAARELGLEPRNVRYCVSGKRHSCGGYVFYRRDDHETWMDAMITHREVPQGCYVTANGRIFPEHRNRKKKQDTTNN